MVAKQGQDYTVYAYDYSEVETPLVGQGMLSWALASAAAATSQSRTLITGRVCKNVLGLFGSGAKETLEVKLRLKPVTMTQQSTSTRGMDKFKEISRMMPSGFDAAAWSAFVQANPAILELAGKLKGGSANSTATPRTDAGLEAVGQLLERASLPAAMDHSLNTPADTYHPHNESIHPFSQAGSRIASPAPRSISGFETSNSVQDRPSRPPSQASMASPETSFSQINSTDAFPEPTHFQPASTHEDGPARKRARVSPADWNGRSTLGTGSEQLRVTASTAASVRVYRPLAQKAFSSGPASVQELPRAPTPRPERATSLPRQRRPGISGPSHPMSHEESTSESIEAPLQYNQPARTFTRAPSSVLLHSDIGSPASIGSSPPVFEKRMTAPSSPILPALPQHIDSGFMSGPPEEDDDVQVHADTSIGGARKEDDQRVVIPRPELVIEEEIPGPPELLPTRILPRPAPPSNRKIVRADSIMSEPGDLRGAPNFTTYTAKAAGDMQRRQSGTYLRSGSAIQSSSGTTHIIGQPLRTYTPIIPRPSVALPPHPASDPVHPTSVSNTQPQSNKESQQSWISTHEQSIGSGPAPIIILDGPQRSGSGAKRRKAIQKRLVSAVSSGETPPFCEHCGAIETPTWRKAWGKTITGSLDHVRVSDEEGGIIAIREVKKDEAGNVVSFGVLKKSLLDSDEDFKEVQFCNRQWNRFGK